MSHAIRQEIGLFTIEKQGDESLKRSILEFETCIMEGHVNIFRTIFRT